MTIRAFALALFLAILAIGTQAQFSNVGVSGTATTEKSSAIKEALADSIRLRAEAHKEKVLAKQGQAAQADTVAAKTKSFAYTKIHIPGSP